MVHQMRLTINRKTSEKACSREPIIERFGGGITARGSIMLNPESYLCYPPASSCLTNQQPLAS